MAKQRVTAEQFLPEAGRRSLEQLAQAAQGCRGCDLYRGATRAVFGEGPRRAEVVLVGEQPGDKEDLAGKPFVGPAGRMLDKALAEAGIERTRTFVTNAVKHFRFERRGKQRLHKKPTLTQVRACLPWLRAEVEQVRPRVVVALGSTAAQALLGREFRITRQRGELFAETGWAERVLATAHPSAILRAPDKAGREAAYVALVADLGTVAEYLRS